jgi:hypothetical protein
MGTKIYDALFLVDMIVPVRERRPKRFIRATGFLHYGFDFVQFVI